MWSPSRPSGAPGVGVRPGARLRAVAAAGGGSGAGQGGRRGGWSGLTRCHWAARHWLPGSICAAKVSQERFGTGPGGRTAACGARRRPGPPGGGGADDRSPRLGGHSSGGRRTLDPARLPSLPAYRQRPEHPQGSSARAAADFDRWRHYWDAAWLPRCSSSHTRHRTMSPQCSRLKLLFSPVLLAGVDRRRASPAQAPKRDKRLVGWRGGPVSVRSPAKQQNRSRGAVGQQHGSVRAGRFSRHRRACYTPRAGYQSSAGIPPSRCLRAAAGWPDAQRSV